jgi:GR25 family glycosyltransferase involved in LPS biosynthesis
MQPINQNNDEGPIFNKLPIYWINLDIHDERKYFMNLQLHDKNHERISGVNGKKLNEDILNKYIQKSKSFGFNNEKMNKGEIGCLLSHIKVFKESLKKNDEYIIVLEDDANIINWMNNDTNKYLLNHYQNHECIQLCIIIPNHTVLPKENPILINWNEENNRYYPWGFAWSTACYIISKNARIKLTELFEQFEQFENEQTIIIEPADIFIYKNLNTQTLFPPIASYNLSFDSSVQTEKDIHNKSYYRILNNYNFNKKLILIIVWFGNLPNFFDLLLYTLKNINYDILFVTDQKIPDIPNNVKILYLTLELFNEHLNKKTEYCVKLVNLNKLVDVKPLFGFLFNEFITGYEYWGWTDIDMLMGDVTKILNDNPDFDIYSSKNIYNGSLMMFKKNLINIYQYIENYENILNDSYVYKLDESLFSKINNKINHLSIYKDEVVS